GFLVSKDGLVYTNRHVVQPDRPAAGTAILVGVPAPDNADRLEYSKAEVVYCAGPHETLDFAVLKVAARPGYGDFAALPLSYEPLELGSKVAAIGYPYIKNDLPVLSFNQGHVSAARVPLAGQSFYQTDAAVNPGN